jgi:hypothetical protein
MRMLLLNEKPESLAKSRREAVAGSLGQIEARSARFLEGCNGWNLANACNGYLPTRVGREGNAGGKAAVLGVLRASFSRDGRVGPEIVGYTVPPPVAFRHSRV